MKKGILILLIIVCSASAWAQEARVYETDLWSPEEFPVNYDCENERERKQDLQSWLYSAQFKRLDLKDALRNGINFEKLPESELTVSGCARYHSGQPLKNGSVVALNNVSGKTTDAETDKDGYFQLPLYDFADGETFLLQGYTKKGKLENFDFIISADSLPLMDNWLCARSSARMDTFEKLTPGEQGLEKTNHLAEVDVKARKPKRENTQDSKELTASRYMDADEIVRRGVSDFKSLILCFSAYVALESDPLDPFGEWAIVSRRGASVLPGSMGKKDASMLVILDGLPAETSQAKDINVTEIKSIEIVTPQYINKLPNSWGAINGAVVIETKNGLGKSSPRKGTIISPKGLSNF